MFYPISAPKFMVAAQRNLSWMPLAIFRDYRAAANFAQKLTDQVKIFTVSNSPDYL